jgi:FkbM family methyltransferase
MESPLFQMYSSIIRWREKHFSSKNIWIRSILRLVGGSLWLLGASVSLFRGIRFPERKLGSRFWIAQWRFEFLMGWIEPETIPWVKKYLKPGMIVVDIGAHIGYYTDLFSRLIEPGGKVYAFEASPENYPILVKNMQAGRRTNIIPQQLAVNDENTTLELYISPGHSNHSIIAERTEKAETVSVQAVRLDDFLNGEKIDFVKMDVEGAEPRVLNGMRKLIQASDNLVMIVEYNHVVLSKAYSSPKVLTDLLKELGFSYKAILENGDLGDIPIGTKTLNLLCWKSKSSDTT